MAINQIKAILLDLDDTFYDYEPCDAAGKKAVYSFLGKKLGKVPREIEKHFRAAREKVKRRIPDTGSSHSRLLYIQNCIERMTGKSNIPLTFAAEKAFWKAYFRTMKLYPGARVFLQKMKRQGLKLAIVSDLTTEIQMRKLLRLGIDSYVDILVTSEEAGKDKPAPNTYRTVLEKLNIKPGEAIMIGNDYKKDFLSAKKMGIFPIWLNTGKKSRPNVTPQFKSFAAIEKFFLEE